MIMILSNQIERLSSSSFFYDGNMEIEYEKKWIGFWAAPQWSLYDVESPGEIN